MWGIARLKMRREDLFLRVFEKRAFKVLHQFEGRDISVLLWSLATLGVNAKNELVQQLAAKAVDKVLSLSLAFCMFAGFCHGV